MDQAGHWRIEPLNHSRSDETLLFVAREFSRASTLHQAVGISASEYYEYLRTSWQEYVFSGPVDTFIAVGADDSVMGCIVSSQFPTVFSELQTVPVKLQPISALLKALETGYLTRSTVDKPNSLLVDIALVHPDARGRGIYQALRTTVHKHAANAGYTSVYGELSSVQTQKVCVEKFGHTVVAEIRFDEFEFQGDKPFLSISSTPSIQLVEGKL